jgi:hypothetical protein
MKPDPRICLAAALLAAAVNGCPGSDTPGRDIRTVPLPGPPDSASLFEPAVAIDAENPDRIVAGAQYGEGYNRGGLRFWGWASADAGRTWSGAEVVPRSLTRPPTMAADLSLAFGPDGAVFLMGISGDTVRGRVPEAALALAISVDGGASFAPHALFGASRDLSSTEFVVSDKPWIVVDGRPRSPHRGSLYLAWTEVFVRREGDGFVISRRLALASSRDGGRTASPLRSIADGGLGAQLAVRPDGTLDVVWLDVEPAAGSEAVSRVLHATSRDGGRTFSPPQPIESVADSAAGLDLPTLAADPSGNLLACWTRGGGAEFAGTEIRCSHFREGEGWAAPVVASTMASISGAAAGYPAAAFAAGAWWLLGYHADSSATRALLACSRNGVRFIVTDTLAVTPLPAERFCPRAGLPCRADRSRFTPGDYVGLAGADRRLAAVYTLPGGGDPARPAEAWASVIDVTPGSCPARRGRAQAGG